MLKRYLVNLFEAASLHALIPGYVFYHMEPVLDDNGNQVDIKNIYSAYDSPDFEIDRKFRLIIGTPVGYLTRAFDFIETIPRQIRTAIFGNNWDPMVAAWSLEDKLKES